MKKQIRLSESDLYNIIKQVLIEQEQEQERELKVWNTNQKEFKFRLFKGFDGNSEKFAKYHNKFYDKIVVDGSLDLQRTPITSLPDNLHVKGYLNLMNCKNLTSLGDNLSVEGNLLLGFTPITSLPDNLSVGGYLDLRRTPIKSLPDNLHVGGSLGLDETPITSLPENLVVKEVIYIRGTPLKNNVELVKKYKAEGYEFNWIT